MRLPKQRRAKSNETVEARSILNCRSASNMLVVSAQASLKRRARLCAAISALAGRDLLRSVQRLSAI